ncbi:MAG: galactose mutarotase [Tannerellaceae bacterium]|jgi:aldose 1-epimerase|nr:galactose mutarotase [Tannerellaceae bacterium]
MKINFIILLNILALVACASTNNPVISAANWGSVDSKPVYLFTLINSNGVTAKITNYGGIVVEFNAPDRNGYMENIVLGLGTLDDYLAGHPAFGCIVGRYINRIGGAKFTLDNTEYVLATNSLGKHSIHGGRRNFSSKVWDATTSSNEQSATLSLSYISADMEEGYPGNLTVKVDYVLNNDNELQIHYAAATDKPTVLNLSNHSYFNLTNCKENVLGHQVIIYADAYTPVDDELIPTGEIVRVEGTPYDLRQWTVISDRLTDLPKGYDNNFCIKGIPGHPVLAAEMYEPKSGRLLQTYTTEPGIGFYTAYGLNCRNKSPQVVAYTSSMGACFEAQHYPDSPNKPNFPSTTLRPGETYMQLTIYKVGVRP